MKKKQYDICIVGGLGHVGLPLGIVFASKGIKVCLYDLNKDYMKIVMEGKLPFIEYGAQPLLNKALKNKTLSVSSKKSNIKKAKFVIVTIGTPVDQYLNPKTKQFLESIKEINVYLDSSQIIIIRSSIFPGCCEQIKNLLHRDEDPRHIAYCPERITQGYAVKELSQLPQIVSGFSDYAINESSRLFKKITKQIVISNVKEAELVKLFSNSWRYIQFAISNQFYMISKDFGEDFNNIHRIMTHGYERGKGLAKAGFAAGPCLLKDTMQLSVFNNNQFQLGQAAMNINEGLPNYIVNNLRKEMDVNRKVIGILGMAFKANVDDIRDSLSYKLRKILIFHGAKVICSDHYVNAPEMIDISELIEKSDLIIIGAPHNDYKDFDYKGKPIIDIWNLLGKD
tara:strand:+ start:538 stop:1725 length:1188 start_codon:yes stop_codon:yes gene_type:complete